MGREANSRKERICKACHQSIYGSAGDIQRHGETCARLAKLDLVMPGLVVGQQAVDVLNRAVAQKGRNSKPRWS